MFRTDTARPCLWWHSWSSDNYVPAGAAGSVAFWHALALVFYGIRLNLFLLYRELCIPRFRKFRETIEERRSGGGDGGSRLSRTPFVVGCATLYACMAAPLFVTSQIAATGAISSSSLWLLKVCVAATWGGFVVAALGDLQKTIMKAVLGEDALVTGGVFARLRHPNYTGEALGWTASFLASVVAATASWDSSFVLPLVASLFGWVGIVGVLAMAATGLEKRQQEKYGGDPEYDAWTRTSWAGPTLPNK